MRIAPSNQALVATMRAPGLAALAGIVAGAALFASAPAAAAAAVQAQGTAGQALADRQVVLITGSTGGLGREVAVHLAGPAYHIIVHGRNVERGREVVREIEAAGGSAVQANAQAYDAEARARLRDLSMELTGAP